MKDLIEYLAKNLVDAPDAVNVVEVPEGRELVVELRVAEADLGKIIGRGGRTARALRTLLSAASGRKHARAVLEILE